MIRFLPEDGGFNCGRECLGAFAVVFCVGPGVGFAEHGFGWGIAAGLSVTVLALLGETINY